LALSLLSRFALTVAVVLGVVAVTYPAGLPAALDDFREYADHATALQDESDREARLEHRGGRLKERIAAKQAVSEDLLAGRLTLNQAAEQFLALNGDDPTPRAYLDRQYGGATLEEKAARWVIDFTVVAVPPAECDRVRARLEDQFRAHYGYHR
jgi:hypothetical protein